MAHRGLLALKVWVLVTWLLAWNAALLLTHHFNGHEPLFQSDVAVLVVIIALGGTSLLAAAIIMSESVRTVLVAPSRRHFYEPGSFWTITVVCGGLAVVFALS